MHVLTDREVPEYEIHPSELDFSNSVKISKVSSSSSIAYCFHSIVRVLAIVYRYGQFTPRCYCLGFDRVPFTRLHGEELMWL